MSERLAAALAAIRERSERPLPGVSALPVSSDAVRYLLESAGDVPRLLAAVEAVTGLADQLDARMLNADWPVSSVLSGVADDIREAVSRGLLGEDDSE